MLVYKFQDQLPLILVLFLQDYLDMSVVFLLYFVVLLVYQLLMIDTDLIVALETVFLVKIFYMIHLIIVVALLGPQNQ